ncbi:hypothetical protein VP01_2067g2 [Puccinia sorghi]|uniref:Uncharacterized protein n=1 Tax=Puccinia sorghi TaxID=27349 RepID=A0A0L6VAJ4_9BASI|nr:hypothetical protein VP01_2067g2 [Puccinia sorghi]
MLPSCPATPSSSVDQSTKLPSPSTKPSCSIPHLYVNNNSFLLQFDQNDSKCIISVMEFTPWEKLSKKDTAELNFISTVLHGSKEFIIPVCNF